MRLVRPLLISVAVALYCGSLAFLSYALFSYKQANEILTVKLQRTSLAINQGVLAYGTVSAVDPATRTLEIRTRNRYENSGEAPVVRFPVATDAFVGYQTLVNDGNALRAATSTVLAPGDISNLVPGTRIRFLVFIPNGSTEATITHLTFGDPL